MSPGLSRRIAAALGAHQVTLDERAAIIDALVTAEDWADLPRKIRSLVETIEARSGWVEDAHVVALVAAGPESVSPDDLAGITPLWSAALVAHLPGKHDQSTHGRGGGGGVRASLAQAATIDEINDVTATELETILGHSVTVDLAGMDPQMARETADGILQGAERFPHARLGAVDTYGTGGTTATHPGDPFGESWAVTTSGRYSRNEDRISFHVSGLKADRHRAQLSVSESAGFMTAGSPRGVALHEFGHIVSGHDNAESRAAGVLERASQGSGVSPARFARQHISDYAAGSHREMVAEAFADVMANGAKASPLSHEIFSVIEADYTISGRRR